MNLRKNRYTFLAFFLIFALLLTACERPLQDNTSGDPANTTNADQTTDNPAGDTQPDDTTGGDTGSTNGNGIAGGNDSADTGTEDVAVGSNEGATDEGATNEGTTDEGATDGSATDEGTTTDEGATDEGATDEGTTTDEGATDEGATDEGTTDEGATDEGTTDEGATGEGATDEGATDENATDEGATDEGTAETTTTNEAGEIEHIVAPGDNLYRIGLQYNVSWVVLANYNGINNPNRIKIGDVIRIPPVEEPAEEGTTEEPADTSGDETADTSGEETAPETPEETIYIVQPGDSLFEISQAFDVEWQQIAEANGIVNPNLIFPGQELKIPSNTPGPIPQFTHDVRPGETLFTISLLYGITWESIAEANEIGSPFTIYVGDVLVIPGAAS